MYHAEQKKRAAAVVEQKYLDPKENNQTIFQQNFDNNLDVFYFFLPFWNTPIDLFHDRKAITLRNQFRMAIQDAENIVSLTKMRTLAELENYYLMNRSHKDYGILSKDEVFLQKMAEDLII